MIAMTALKVAAFAAALGMLLSVMVWLWKLSLSMDERLAITFSDSGYLTRNHLPTIVMVAVAVLCVPVAVIALMVAAIAWAVGA